MRTLLLELRPHELAEIELHELLEQLIAAMECRKRMHVTAQLQPVELDAAKRVMLYRIAQEALTNITRHSAATAVSIALDQRKAHDASRLDLLVRPPAWLVGPSSCASWTTGAASTSDTVTPVISACRSCASAPTPSGPSSRSRAAPGHGTELTVLVAQT